MAKELAKLFVALGLDDKGFQKSLNSIQKNLNQVGKAMTGIGVGITAAMGIAVKEFAQTGDEIQKMSQKTGFSTETLSELGYAAKLSGTDLNTIQTAVKGMANVLSDAERGLSTAKDALADLGLSVEDFAGLSPEAAFNKMLDALAGVEDPLKKAALAQDVFSRSGLDMLPMLSGGTKGLQAMRQEARDLGLVFSSKQADSAAAFNDAISKLTGSLKGFMFTIAGELVPLLKPIIDRFTEIGKQVAQWAKANPALTQTLVVIVAAIGGLFAILGPILLMLPMIAAGFTIMLGPVGLVILAVMALIAVGVLLWKNWDAIVAWFQTIPETIGKAFSTLTDIILAPFRAAWRGIESAINWLITALNSIRVDIPAWVPGIGGKSFGVSLPPVTLPKFAGGAIVTRPTVGMVGEAGPEAIIPLGKLGGTGTTINIYPQNLIGTKEEIVRYVRESLLDIQGNNATLGFA